MLKVSKMTESRMAAGMLFQSAGKECRWKSNETCGRYSTSVLPACNSLGGWRMRMSHHISDSSARLWIALKVIEPKLSGTGTKRCLRVEFCIRWKRSRCAEMCCRAHYCSCSNQNVNQRYWLQQIWQR